MAKTSLDEIASRIMAREEKRKQSGFPYIMKEDPVGDWNHSSVTEKTNWNLTEKDIKDIQSALADSGVFETDIVETKETNREQCNDAVQRMKNGDCSKFNHLPHFLREYYGRNVFKEFFGTDQFGPDNPLPPLNDEMKQKLEDAGMTNRPEFRYMLTQLIERGALDSEGNLIADQLLKYDQYLNQRMLSRTLDPVDGQREQNILNKFPGKEGEKMLRVNQEKQLLMAKTLFMTQLGRIDIKSEVMEDEKLTEPYEGNIVELYSHSGRVMFTLPHGESSKQDKMFDAWQKRTLESEGMWEGRFASHDIKRRHVNDYGEVTQASKEIKLKWKEQLKNGQLNKKITTYFGNYGMNIPLGGLGQKFNGNDCVDGQGSFGHMYIREKKGDKNICGSILVGIENAAPKMESSVGQLHNYKAIGHDMSPFYSGKATPGAQYDGREVDLSHLKPEELTKALQDFEVGYAQLQREAKTDPQSMQKLKEINEKICGKYMNAMELANLMTSVGIKKEEAIRLTEAGRSAKNADYIIHLGGPDVYREDMHKVLEPEKVKELPQNEAALKRMQQVAEKAEYVDELRRQWNSMASHTGFSIFNSSEFKKMEKAFGRYVKAYDNIMSGKTAEGKELRANSKGLSEFELGKLKKYEKDMVAAAKQYHMAKTLQKEGGFEKHKTDQARDRDAMSMVLSDFENGAKKFSEENPMKMQNNKLSEKEKNARARKNLDKKVEELRKGARAL